MAEFLVEDYFAGGTNGAANDSTDCTPAIQAALDDLASDGENGTITFPSGICRMTGSVAKELSNSGTPQGQVTIKGTGDSAIRLMGTGGTRIQIGGLEQLIWRNMVLLGDMSGGGTTQETNGSHLHLTAESLIIEYSQFYGLGVSGSTGAVVNMQGGRFASMHHCLFRGTNGGLTRNVYAAGCDSLDFDTVHFIDYGSYKNESFSKGGGGCTCWIEVPNGNGIYSKVSMRNLFGDEGAQTALYKVANCEWAKLERVYGNVSGAGKGLVLDTIHSAHVEMSNFGYTNINPKVGISADDVAFLKLSSVRFLPGDTGVGTDTLELLGNTRKVVMEDCSRGLTSERFPFLITNTANADLVIDGKTYWGEKADYT